MTPPPRVLALPGGEPILRYGPADGPQIVVLQPLFEEANRCRALVTAVCRGLAARGVGCWLPDLPGTGESVRALDDVAWRDWAGCVADAAVLVERESGVVPASAAIRGGALLDGGFARRWRLSPVAGASLAADLRRAGLTGAAMAGYALSDDLAAALREAEPRGEARTLRLAGDDRGCDMRVVGPALWRRSEPAADGALAAALVDDLAAFAPPSPPSPRTCSGVHGSARAPAATPAERWMPEQVRHDDRDGGRRIIWEGDLALTLDGPPDATCGWVFVTGGTQTRVGPHRLYERLAHALATRGEAVVRFDRPGVGDSEGDDPGFDSGEAIAAAAAALRDAFPALTDLAGFGLCDGATALALHSGTAGIARVVLANPWVVEAVDELPPAAAIRGHYRDRLRDPAAWGRLLRGGVDLRRLARGIARGVTRSPAPPAARLAAGLPADARVVLADGDGTARAFDLAWQALHATPPVETVRIATPSHSFAGAAAFAALADALTRRR